MQRKNAILNAANHHFAHYGFLGASLRDIARDAQVSLTLLNHHFGSKYQLLSAVIDSHRTLLDERTASLLQLVSAGRGRFDAQDLVRCAPGCATAFAPPPSRTARTSCA